MEIFFTHDNTRRNINPNAAIIKFANQQEFQKYIESQPVSSIVVVTGNFAQPWKVFENFPTEEQVAPFTLSQVDLVNQDGGTELEAYPNVPVKVLLSK